MVGAAPGEAGDGVEGVLGLGPGRSEAEHDRGLQGLVVQEEVIGRRSGEITLLIEVGPTQIRHSLLELSAIDLAGPMVLQRPLELAVGPDARKTNEMS